MNTTSYQVTVIEFCLFLSDKYMEGKKVDEVEWDEIEHRIGRQNLTVGEEKRVMEYVRNQRTAMYQEELAAKKADAAIDRAKQGLSLSFGLKLKAVA